MSEPQEDKLLGHEYDGIREYDNPMPGWWKAIFWASFYFSVGYFFHYHVSGNGDSVSETFEKDVAAAREQEAQALMGTELSEESLAAFMPNQALMVDAQKLFIQKCQQCHGAKGEGLIGPNLTDEYWVHGDGSLMAIHKVVSEGVPAKGMPPWGRQLRPVELSKIVAFIGTLRNTNVSGPRGNEGQPVAPKQ